MLNHKLARILVDPQVVTLTPALTMVAFLHAPGQALGGFTLLLAEASLLTLLAIMIYYYIAGRLAWDEIPPTMALLIYLVLYQGQTPFRIAAALLVIATASYYYISEYINEILPAALVGVIIGYSLSPSLLYYIAALSPVEAGIALSSRGVSTRLRRLAILASTAPSTVTLALTVAFSSILLSVSRSRVVANRTMLVVMTYTLGKAIVLGLFC